MLDERLETIFNFVDHEGLTSDSTIFLPTEVKDTLCILKLGKASGLIIIIIIIIIIYLYFMRMTY